MSTSRLTATAGKALVGFGLLVLAFLAYQLWGTTLIQSGSQSRLRAAIAAQLAPGATRSAGSSAAPVLPGAAVALIDIPSIGVDKAVVQGVAEADLEQGPGHYPGTPMPGQPGNAAIAGHRTTFGGPFYRLNFLTPGDSVFLTTTQGTFRYVVRRSFVVSPSDTAVVAPSRSNMLTLTTCTPLFSAAKRLVVQAALVGRPAPVAQKAATAPSGGGSPRLARTGAAPGRPWIYPVANLGGVLGPSPYPPALCWGAALAAVAAVVRAASRRAKARAAVWLAAFPLLAAMLFIFFTALDQAMPPSL